MAALALSVAWVSAALAQAWLANLCLSEFGLHNLH